MPPLLPSLNPYGPNFDDCTIGAACSRGISVTSGTAPFSWTASGLPPGMSIRTGDGATSSGITPGDMLRMTADVVAAKRVTAGRYTLLEDGVIPPAPTGDWVSRWEPGPSQVPDVRRRIKKKD